MPNPSVRLQPRGFQAAVSPLSPDSLAWRMAAIDLEGRGLLTPTEIRERALIEEQFVDATASFGVSGDELNAQATA